METFEKIIEITKGLGFGQAQQRVTSSYDSVGSVNVRVSDHFPKDYNLVQCSDDLVEADGVVKYFFVVISNDRVDEDDLAESIEDRLGDYLEKEVQVEIMKIEENDKIDIDWIKEEINKM